MAAAAERPSAGGFVLWLHGSGGSGDESRAQVAPYFSAPGIASSVRLSFPTAPTASIPCYGCNLLCCFALWLLCKARDAVITAWFGISEVPITAKTVRDEKEVLKAVEYVHELLDKEVAAGTSPSDIFVCGMSQGGALAIASVLLYPKALGGCAVFSGSVPLNKSFAEKVSSEARKTPVLWFHGMADGLVLFEAGHAGCAFLEELGMSCEFKAYPTLGHSMVDEELQYFQQWILNRLGMTVSGATETARPSSSSNHKDPQ
ncbi:probable carboxylesterase Os04g0669600 isoform X1 [Miscanthus floridulus]|uniref:probable carboxylesterase Os04g0669600 isoform X1 n=1 Tax=Miscanthus floridulus TaxID=154761 RepID=UPI00345891AC